MTVAPSNVFGKTTDVVPLARFLPLLTVLKYPSSPDDKIGDVEDTFNSLTGEFVQRIGIKVFDGTEGWVQNGIIASNVRMVHTVPNYKLADGVHTHLKKTTSSDNFGVFWGVGINHIINDAFGITNTLNSTADNIIAFKAYLAAQYAAGTPVTVLYQLATPITTYYDKLKTFYPSTTISSDVNMTATVKVMD